MCRAAHKNQSPSQRAYGSCGLGAARRFHVHSTQKAVAEDAMSMKCAVRVARAREHGTGAHTRNADSWIRLLVRGWRPTKTSSSSTIVMDSHCQRALPCSSPVRASPPLRGPPQRRAPDEVVECAFEMCLLVHLHRRDAGHGHVRSRGRRTVGQSLSAPIAELSPVLEEAGGRSACPRSSRCGIY